jgi:uncharacterized membrane protein YtjA (UPF0391 family)
VIVNQSRCLLNVQPLSLDLPFCRSTTVFFNKATTFHELEQQSHSKGIGGQYCSWPNENYFQTLETAMLSWALTFLVIALIAGVLGFGVVAGTAATIAKVCFFVFLVLFVLGLLMGRRGPAV